MADIFEFLSGDFDDSNLKKLSDSISDIGSNVRKLKDAGDLSGLQNNLNKLASSADNFAGSLDSTSASQSIVRGKINKLKSEYTKLAEEIEAAAKSSNLSQAAFDKLKAKSAALVNEYSKVIDKSEALIKKFKDLKKEMDFAASSEGKLTQANKIASGSFSNLIKTVRDHKKNLGEVTTSSAIAAGAVLLVGKAAGTAANELRDAIKGLNQYQVQAEATSKVSLASPGGVSGLEKLRETIGTTRIEFQPFLGSLKEASKVGINTDSLQSAAKNIVNLYGEGSEAQTALKEYADLLMTMPSLEQDLEMGITTDDSAAALFALAEQGKVDVAIKAGLFGGIEEGGSEAAQIQTDVQKSLRVQEDIKNEIKNLASIASPMLSSLQKIGDYTKFAGVGLGILQTLSAGSSAIASAQRQTMITLMGLNVGKRNIPGGGKQLVDALKKYGSGAGAAVKSKASAAATKVIGQRGVAAVSSAGIKTKALAIAGKGVAKVGGAALTAAVEIYRLVEAFPRVQKDIAATSPIMKKFSAVIGTSKASVEEMNKSFKQGTSVEKTFEAFNSAISGDTNTGLTNLGTVVSATSGQLAELTIAGAAAGFMIGGSLGAGIGSLVGVLAGSVNTLLHQQAAIEAEEKARTKVIMQTMNMADQFGQSSSDFDGMRKKLKGLAFEVKKTKDSQKVSKDAALIFEQTIKSLDAAAKSPIIRFHQMSQELSKASMDISKKLGGSTTMYVQSAKEVTKASGAVLVKRFKDTANVMTKQIGKLNNADPRFFAMAMQKAEKTMADETSRFVSELENTITRLGETPGLMESILRGELSTSAQNITQAFGAGLDISSLGSTFDTQVAQAAVQMQEAGVAARAMMMQFSDGMNVIEKSKSQLKDFSVKLAGGISDSQIEKLAKASGRDAGELKKAMENLKKGQPIENVDELSSAISSQAGDVNKNLMEVSAQRAAAAKLTGGIGSTVGEQQEKKKEQLGLELDLSKVQQELNTIGNKLGEPWFKMADNMTTSEKKLLEERQKALQNQKAQLKSKAKNIKGGDEIVGKVESLGEEELSAQFEANKAEYEALDVAQKEYRQTIVKALGEMDIPGFEGAKESFLQWMNGADAMGASTEEIAKKARNAFGKRGMDSLRNALTQLRKREEDLKEVAQVANKLNAGIKSSGNLANKSQLLALRTAQAVYQKMMGAAQTGFKSFQNFLKAETSSMVQAGLKVAQLSSFESAFGDIGMPYELFGERFEADMENMSAVFDRANQIRDKSDEKIAELMGAIKEAFGGQELKVNPDDVDGSIRTFLEKSAAFKGKSKEVQDKIVERLKSMGEDIGFNKLSPENIAKAMKLQAGKAALDMELKAIGSVITQAAKNFDASDIAKSLGVVISSSEEMIKLARFGGIDVASQTETALAAISARGKAEEKLYSENIARIRRARAESNKKLDKQLETAAPEDINKIEATRIAMNRKANAEEVKARNSMQAAMIKAERDRLQIIMEGLSLQMGMSEAAQQIAETQLDLLEQVGAPFSLILERQVDIVTEAKKQADIQTSIFNAAKAEGITGLELEQKRVNMIKAQAEVTKKTVQAQRSSMEKLLGAAMSQLGEIGGFKRNLLAQQKGTGLVIGPGGMVQGGAGAAKSKAQQAMEIQAGAMIEGSGQKSTGTRTSKDTKEASENVGKSVDESVKVQKEGNEIGKSSNSKLSDIYNAIVGSKSPKSDMFNTRTPAAGGMGKPGAAVPDAERIRKEKVKEAAEATKGKEATKESAKKAAKEAAKVTKATMSGGTSSPTTPIDETAKPKPKKTRSVEEINKEIDGVKKGIKELESSKEARLISAKRFKEEKDLVGEEGMYQSANQIDKDIKSQKSVISKLEVEKERANKEKGRKLAEEDIKTIDAKLLAKNMWKDNTPTPKPKKTKKQQESLKREKAYLAKKDREFDRDVLGIVREPKVEAVPGAKAEAVPGMQKSPQIAMATTTKTGSDMMGGATLGRMSAVNLLRPGGAKATPPMRPATNEETKEEAPSKPSEKKETPEEKAKREKAEEAQERAKQQAEEANELLSQLDGSMKVLGKFLVGIETASQETARNTQSIRS